ncbi:MAG: ATP-binding protein [Anaerolineae bacterium]|nr:ATP-binding protein [Anaerolineae bacterium]
MASADLLKSLFRSFRQGDEETFYKVAEQIILQEKKKNHNILARDLKFILENGARKSNSTTSIYDFEKLPKDHERGFDLVEVRFVDRLMSEVVLTEKLGQQVKEIITEYFASDVLRSYGLRPKQKLLFTGPPGCGKTITTEILASELGLPILYTRFDSIISSYLGETASNLRKIFEYASKGTWLIFFDEFDAIGKSRNDPTEHGELKRVVNSFLQLLDNFHTESIIVAATNHESLLDKALWRRFDDILFFDKPSEAQIVHLIKIKLRNYPNKVNPTELASKMLGFSHADVERVCIEAIKSSIIGDEKCVNNSIFEIALKHQQERIDRVSND